ncbi:hypothetical protein DRQ19_04035 [bacterium]|nr:MAG: hypothetical protein DRQ19_04035 [bacterium]
MRHLPVIAVFLSLVIAVSGCQREQKTEQDYLSLIERAKGEGDVDGAMRFYEKLIKKFPESPQIKEYEDEYIRLLFDAAEKEEKRATYYLDKVKLFFAEREKTPLYYEALYLLGKHFEGAADSARAGKYFADIPPREYFRIAQDAQTKGNSLEAIACYKKLLDIYPDYEKSCAARFMMGFVYSEQLKDYPKAREAFQEFLEACPGNELEESAKWMLENMGKPIEQVFKGKPSPA